MAEKTMTITLEIRVRDFDNAERKECAAAANMPISEIRKLSQRDIGQIPRLIADYLEKSDQQEIWAGTGIFARIAGVSLVSTKSA